MLVCRENKLTRELELAKEDYMEKAIEVNELKSHLNVRNEMQPINQTSIEARQRRASLFRRPGNGARAPAHR